MILCAACLLRVQTVNKHPQWYAFSSDWPGDSMTRFVVGEDRNLKIGLFTELDPKATSANTQTRYQPGQLATCDSA